MHQEFHHQDSKIIFYKRREAKHYSVWTDASWVRTGLLISNQSCCWVTLIASAKLLLPIRLGCNPRQLMNYQVGFQVQGKPWPDAPNPFQHSTLQVQQKGRQPEGQKDRKERQKELETLTERTEMISVCWWKNEEQRRDVGCFLVGFNLQSSSLYLTPIQESTVSAAVWILMMFFLIKKQLFIDQLKPK